MSDLKTITIPWPPTEEMMRCLYVDKWPEDWERGKRLQREWKTPRIPYNTESEMIAGQLERFIEAARAALPQGQESADG